MKPLSLLISLLCFSCGRTVTSDSDGIPVAVLLPFSGAQASSGINIERALILAKEDIKNAGGIDGRTLLLKVQDSHSDLDHSLEVVGRLLKDEGIPFLLGPEEPGISSKIARFVRDQNAIELLPGVTSVSFASFVGGRGHWFGMSPGVVATSLELATAMFNRGIRKLAVIRDNDDYSISFTTLMSGTFSNLGGSIGRIVPVSVTDHDYTDAIIAASANAPEAIVLAMSSGVAAAVIQSGILLGAERRWYFGPMLKNEVFLENVPPGTIDGMIGIAPALAGEAAEFTEHFQKRWSGETPLPAAYFYYDALVTLALAVQKSYRVYGREANTDQIADILSKISTHGGQATRWDDLSTAFERVRNGIDIQYVGASGVIHFDKNNEREQQPNLLQLWTVTDHQIVDLPSR